MFAFILGFDPMYFLFLAPGMLLALWAQARVSSAYAQGSQVAASSKITGAQAASEIMRAEGVDGVRIEPVAGQLTDHYDPREKVLRLSEGVFAGRSLAALGIAAHEAGHAIQDAHHDVGLVARNLIVPLAGFGSSTSYVVMFIGAILGSLNLIILGIVLFSATVLFQLVNLPVEFDASRRARRALAMTGLISPREDETVANVLNAAAWTYVAATLSSILTLLYFLYRFGLLGNRRDD